jgi:hypothetical protein
MATSNSVYRKMSSEAVKAKTGKDWKAWFAILDKFDLKKKGHAPAAKHLRDKHGLTPWWSQAVTIRYEWDRGLRK